MSINLTVKGIKELQDEMVRAESSLSPPTVKLMLFDAMKIIEDAARSNARSMFGRSGKNREGWSHLEDALVTKPGASNTLASAWNKVSRKLAPQGLWLEFGHRIVARGHSSAARKAGAGDTGGMVRPYPWYRPAVDERRAEVCQRIQDGIAALLRGVYAGRGSRGGDLQ